MKKILLRLLAFLGFCLVSLITFMLNPSLAYSHSTSHKNITVYHNDKLDDSLTKIIEISLEDIKAAKIYQQNFQSDLCLNDGSFYPKLVKTILGDDVFTAFSNKVVVLGEKSNEFNRFYKWDKELKLGCSKV